VTEPVDLGSPTMVEQTITLSEGLAVADVSGLFRSRTGQHRSKGITISLRAIDDPDCWFLSQAGYSREDGEQIARFHLKDVPVQEYEITISPLDNMRWGSRRRRLLPPCSLEFECDDSGRASDLEFRTTDAAGGDAIEEFWAKAYFEEEGGELVELRQDWESEKFLRVPDSTSVQYVVRANGYRVARGSRQPGQQPGDGLVSVALERGWGQLFRVVEKEGTPIEAVEVLVDGEVMGRTDRHGFFELNLPVAPSSIEFRRGDWTVIQGSGDPGASSYEWGAINLIRMEPSG